MAADDVRRLYVAVQEALAVQVIECLKDLQAGREHRLERFGGGDRAQGAAARVLKHQVMTLGNVSPDADDVRTVQLGQVRALPPDGLRHAIVDDALDDDTRSE